MRWGSIIATALTLLAIAIMVKLGFWQLDRAAEKQLLFDDFTQAQTAANDASHQPLPQQPTTAERFKPVTVSGQFHSTYLLLDNQIHQGQVGYQVIGLLEAEDRQTLVPVNLGWIPVGDDRTLLPTVELPELDEPLRGWLYFPADDAFMLGDQVIEPGLNPYRIQQLNAAAISDALTLPIADYVVLLSEQENYGWPRQWEPQVMSPAKHQAYALQWFSLAFAAFVVLLLVRRSITKTKKECA